MDDVAISVRLATLRPQACTKMNLNDLRFFVSVVDHGGYSAAARALQVPKSTLSKRVAALEDALGGRLLHRSSRRQTLTFLGEMVLPHARAAVAEGDAVLEAAEILQSEPRGVVRLTCSTITAQYYLAPLWPDFAEAHPRVQLSIHASDRMVDLVSEGFDLAVRDHVGDLADSGLIAMRLGSEADLLVASPDWLRHNGRPAVPADLDGAAALTCTGRIRQETWHLTHPSGESRTVLPKVRFASDDPASVVAMVCRSRGVARLPRCVCGPLLATGAVEAVLPDWSMSGPFCSLVYPQRRGQLPAVRAVIDFLSTRLPPLMREV